MARPPFYLDSRKRNGNIAKKESSCLLHRGAPRSVSARRRHARAQPTKSALSAELWGAARERRLWRSKRLRRLGRHLVLHKQSAVKNLSANPDVSISNFTDRTGQSCPVTPPGPTGQPPVEGHEELFIISKSRPAGHLSACPHPPTCSPGRRRCGWCRR